MYYLVVSSLHFLSVMKTQNISKITNMLMRISKDNQEHYCKIFAGKGCPSSITIWVIFASFNNNNNFIFWP